MRRYFIPLLTIILASCVLYGSGTKIVTGKLFGTVPAGVRIGLFPWNDANTFIHDDPNDADKDNIYSNKEGALVGTFTPVIVVTPTGSTYSITLPDDPATIKCMIAWDDDGDNIFDIATEAAYLPVKTLGSSTYTIHHFDSIGVARNIIYEAIYSNMDPLAADFNTLHNDNFDAIGAGDFNFYFD